MVEYIYDIIKVSADEAFSVSAIIADEDGNSNLSGFQMCIYDKKDNLIASSIGELNGEEYLFTFAPIGKGKYFYVIKDLEENSLQFKQPIYFA